MLGSVRRLMVAGAAVLAAGATAVPAHAATVVAPAASSGSINPATAAAPSNPALTRATGRSVHAMRPKGSTLPPTTSAPVATTVVRDGLTNGSGQLTYNGGFVQDSPSIFLDFWGSEWTSTTTGKEGQNYVTSFVNDIMTSAWLTSQTQYCEHINAGIGSDISSCPGNVHAGLIGSVQVWNDNTAPATTPNTLADVGTEAEAARAHFQFAPRNPNATVIVLSPSGKSNFNIQGVGPACGFHWQTFDASNILSTVFAYVPWSPDATPAGACPVNTVNQSNDSFGHGLLDGLSMVTGHEIAEAITDPVPGAGEFGWTDSKGFETGDKCTGLPPPPATGPSAWPPRNVTFASNFYAVQPLWSDAAGTCALESVGGLSTNQPAIATQDSLHRDVFVRSGDGAVWTRSSTSGPWGGWTSLGGFTPNGPAAVSWGPGRIDIFVRGGDNGLWHRGWDPVNKWSPWLPLGGIITSAPAVASWAANRLDVFARGNDGALWHIGYDGVAWRNWESLGGAVTADPGAVSWAPGRIDVFIRSNDNGMWHIGYNGAWSGWESHGGGFTSGFTASSTAANQVSAYAVGLDHQIYRLSWNGSAWVGWQALGGQLTQAPAAVAPPGGTLPVELFTTGSNGTTERLVLGI